MADREKAALRIVDQALEKSGDERATFVADACKDDTALRDRVERLLAYANSELTGLLTGNFVDDEPEQEGLPDRIGPFRLTGLIGRGGMGVVVAGERDDGLFQQKVAIKLVRSGLMNDHMRERFDQERRILGRLTHPGIARILDGGDVGGRPWLAMEFLEGEPVTRVLARKNADLDMVLDSFEAICDAVSHAHRNLVIHADIKPSNVVMEDDGQVKLLDFGIACLILDFQTDNRPALHPLTPSYAAPERQEGSPPSIASDVYSLGALLHEMLTGVRPEQGRAASTLVSNRLASKDLRGDLDAILHKALADDPALRYPDVSSLLADIRAFRGHWPVAAHGSAGWRYSMAKFLRRHRTGATLVSVTLAALLIVALVSMLMYARAETARREADRRFLEVRQLVHYLLFDHYDQLAALPGTVESRVRIAGTAGRYLDQLRQVPDAPADLRLDSARGYRRLALVQGVSGVSSLGDVTAARRSLDKADILLSDLIREQPKNADALAELGWVETNRWALGADDAGSVARNRRADRLFAAALAQRPSLVDARLGRITAQKNQGYDLIWGRNQPARALTLLRGALAQLRGLAVGRALQEDKARLEFALLNRIGDATYFAGDEQGALAPYREAAALAEAHIAARATPFWLSALAESHWNIGSTVKNPAAGLEEVRRGKLAIDRALAFGADANAQKFQLILLGHEANLLHAMGRSMAAVPISNQGLAIREARLAAAPGDPVRLRDIAIALPSHADILAAAGQPESACAAARRAVALLDQLAARRQIGERDRAVDMPAAADAVRRHCTR